MSSKTKESTVDQREEKEFNHAIESFETRWRYAVFPAMIAFVILAGFGFYLIYGMLQRMEDLAVDINEMAKVMRDSLPVMQGGVVGMSSRMQWIGEDLHGMREDVSQLSTVIQNTMPNMEGKVGDMSENISNMTYATSSMATTTQNMGQNLWNMNRNISKPLSMMRKMIPWSGDKTPPPPAMTPMPQMYNPYANQQQVQIVPTTPVTVATTQDNTTVATIAPTTSGVEENTEVSSATETDSSVILGKQKFVNLCASCHGTNAEGGVGPSLTAYTAEQIQAIFQEYRLGKRSGTMTGIVKTFTTEDVTNISTFLEFYNKKATASGAVM